MKQLFDYLPVVVFFGLYFLSGRDIMLATWGIIAATSFQVVAGRLIWRRWHRLHLMVLAVTLVFGGLTLLLRDDVFIKWRPSIISFVLAAVLLGGHFLRERNLLQRLCEKLMISGFGFSCERLPFSSRLTRYFAALSRESDGVMGIAILPLPRLPASTIRQRATSPFSRTRRERDS